MNDIGGNGQPLVVARDLKKAYQIGDRRLEVLRGVSLAVARGEFVALRGASGAGKSTLLHLLGGLDHADSGQIEFEGTTLSGRSLSSLAEFRNQHVGIIFQAYHLLADPTALENVFLPARMGRMPGAQARQRAETLLKRVGLGDRMGHRPSQLSGGEQQRVAIARCLINSPSLILADEPTGNLDSHTGDEVMNLLLELRGEHRTTLVIATHDARVAARAEREVRLVDGLAEDPPMVRS